MDYRVVSGIQQRHWCQDGVDAHCFLLCCVSFHQKNIITFACARKVPPTLSDGGTPFFFFFFIMHEKSKMGEKEQT